MGLQALKGTRGLVGGLRPSGTIGDLQKTRRRPTKDPRDVLQASIRATEIKGLLHQLLKDSAFILIPQMTSHSLPKTSVMSIFQYLYIYILYVITGIKVTDIAI